MNSYFFYKGIKELAKKLEGDERICLTIRPYGFHAGNQIPFTIYPRLLSQEVEKLKKKVRFKIFVVFNDCEQLKLDGPNVELYPFNVFPKDTILQYTKHPYNVKNKNIVDYWGPKIYEDVLAIKKEYPLIDVEEIRASEFKTDKKSQFILLKTIKEPEIFINILKNYTNKNILKYPLDFIIAVCPKCNMTKGKTKILKNNIINHFCSECFKVYDGHFSKFDFWIYHTLLALPRYQILSIDLCITGADKINESDYIVREKLLEAYGISLKMPDVLYTPLVIDKKGNRMGKSKGNHKYIKIDVLKKLVILNKNKKSICLG